MKTFTRNIFVADDGTEFLHEADAKTYEERKEIEKLLEEHIIYGETVVDFELLVEQLLAWKAK
jgi:hypothetical protein